MPQVSAALWEKVPSDQSGLALLIESNKLAGSAVILRGDKGETLSETIWRSDLPFLRQYRLAPGVYEVHLPGPVRSFAIKTVAGTVTYLKVTRYSPQGVREPGVQISVWRGSPGEEISRILRDLAAKKSGNLPPVTVESGTLGLHFSTDPPWEIPPPTRK